MMTVRIHWVLPLSLIIAALAGCRAGGERSVVGGGSNTAELAVQAWQSSLASKDITLTYRSNGERVGAKEFYQGTADFVLSARESLVVSNEHAEEQEQQSYVKLPVLVVDIAVVHTHPGCRLSLTKKELKAVFSGQIPSFSKLGCGNSPVTVLTREQDSGTRQVLYRYLGIGDGNSQQSDEAMATEPVVTRNMANVINSVSGGIGYIPGPLLSFDNISTVALKGGSGKSYQPRISPSAAEKPGEFSSRTDHRSIEGSADYPIKSVVYLYIKKKGNGNKLPAVRDLAKFVISDQAQELAEEIGYIKLSKKQIEQAESAIQEITN